MEFDAGTVTCGEFMNARGGSSSDRARYETGRLWILGYLAGFYAANNELEMAENTAEAGPVENLMHQMCLGFPRRSLLAVSMMTLSIQTHKLPAAPSPDFTVTDYTCGQHVDAKTVRDATADAAEPWAFAFIQGYKNVESPRVEIPIANKGALTAAVVKNCRANRDMAFIDLTTQVAAAVRVEPVSQR